MVIQQKKVVFDPQTGGFQSVGAQQQEQAALKQFGGVRYVGTGVRGSQGATGAAPMSTPETPTPSAETLKGTPEQREQQIQEVRARTLTVQAQERAETKSQTIPRDYYSQQLKGGQKFWYGHLIIGEKIAQKIVPEEKNKPLPRIAQTPTRIFAGITAELPKTTFFSPAMSTAAAKKGKAKAKVVKTKPKKTEKVIGKIEELFKKGKTKEIRTELYKSQVKLRTAKTPAQKEVASRNIRIVLEKLQERGIIKGFTLDVKTGAFRLHEGLGGASPRLPASVRSGLGEPTIKISFGGKLPERLRGLPGFISGASGISPRVEKVREVFERKQETKVVKKERQLSPIPTVQPLREEVRPRRKLAIGATTKQTSVSRAIPKPAETVKTTPIQITPQAPRLGTPQKQTPRLGQPTPLFPGRPGVELKTPKPFPIKLPGLGRFGSTGRVTRKSLRRRQPTRYTPTIKSIVFNISAPSIPKSYTQGLGAISTRPVIKPRKKKKSGKRRK